MVDSAGEEGHVYEPGIGRAEGRMFTQVIGSVQQVVLRLEQHPGGTEIASSSLDSLIDHTPTAPRPCCSAPRVSSLLAILWIIFFVLKLAEAFPQRLNSAGSNYCPHKKRL